MYCKNLLRRQKKYRIVFYCKEHKKYINTLTECENCSKRNLITNRGIKKMSNKRIFVNKEIYDIVYKRDNEKCRLCGTTKELQLHHIFGRGKELTNNIDNCIMLCRHCHLEVVHKNQKKYRPILKELIKNEYRNI